MKTTLITTIEQAMLKKLDNAQLQALHEVPVRVFKGVSVTAVADADKSPDNTVSQANLKKVPVIIPNAHSLERFNTIIQPIFATIRNYRDENECLAALRDTLLPKLMNGEIDVSAVKI